MGSPWTSNVGQKMISLPMWICYIHKNIFDPKMGQNYFFGCISFNLKVIWPNLVRSEILDLGTLDLETAVYY